jgi:anaerobic magnesium-protoporphyrin IX monomethyl ester cyclase
MKTRLVVAFAPPPPGDPDGRHFPTGPLIIASVLEECGIEVEVVDLQFLGPKELTVEAVSRRILEGPRVVALSAMCDALPVLVAACRQAKKLDPEKVIVLGGPGATPVAGALLARHDAIDIIVLGEGEQTVRELFPMLRKGFVPEELYGVKGIAFRSGGRVVVTEPRSPLKDLDQVPFPAYHLVNTRAYDRVGIPTSRGCPYRCTFCSTAPLWGRDVRFRSPERIVDELELLSRKGMLAGNRFVYTDDLFTVSPTRVDAVCRLMMQRELELSWGCMARVNDVRRGLLEKMRGAGCVGLALGVESGSDRILQRIGKGFRAAQVSMAIVEAGAVLDRIRLFFLWGFPFETMVDLLQTCVLMDRVSHQLGAKRSLIGLGMVTPLAGSSLHAQYAGDLRLDWELYLGSGGIASKSFIASQEIRREVAPLIEEAPEVFPAFYCFRQQDLPRKLAMLNSMRHNGGHA